MKIFGARLETTLSALIEDLEMQVLATGEHSRACQGSHIFLSWVSPVKSHCACIKGAGEGEGGNQRIGCRPDPSRKNVVQTRQGCMVWMWPCPFPVNLILGSGEREHPFLQFSLWNLNSRSRNRLKPFEEYLC